MSDGYFCPLAVGISANSQSVLWSGNSAKLSAAASGETSRCSARHSEPIYLGLHPSLETAVDNQLSAMPLAFADVQVAAAQGLSRRDYSEPCMSIVDPRE
jgi:hypothetical protein